MQRFNLKPVGINAVQFNGTEEQIAELNHPDIRYVGGGKGSVHQGGNTINFAAGDFLIIDEQGRAGCLPEAVFWRHYELDTKEGDIPQARHKGDSTNGLVTLRSRFPKNYIMAEVGCFRGESTAVWAEEARLLFAVDPWRTEDHYGPNITPTNMNLVERDFDARMDRFGKRVVKIKATSLVAAQLFPNFSLDVVYIDANHHYDFVKKDLIKWLPKIKPGTGIICGHDFNEATWGEQVSRAVREVLGEPDEIFPDCSWMVRITKERFELIDKLNDLRKPATPEERELLQ